MKNSMSKLLVGLSLLIAPWLIFGLIAASTRTPSTIALFITLAVSAFGLTILITKPPKKP
jgi:quinol-cytochrome oxidoreductase complex cytochrome b subunit